MIQRGLKCPVLVQDNDPRSRKSVTDSGRLGLFWSRFATYSSHNDLLRPFASLREIECHLQPQPGLSATPEPLVKANRHLRRNTAFAIYQIIECLTGHAKNPGRFRHRKPKRFETVVPNRLARMRRVKHCHVHNLSMIVEKIHVGRITLLESENDPPVRLHGHTPESGKPSLQWMQPEPWQVHMFRFTRLVQARQNSADLFEMHRVQPTLVIALIQALQAAMPEATYHKTSVDRQASLVNALRLPRRRPHKVIR